MRVAVIGVGQIPSEQCKRDMFSDQSALISKAALADAALDIGQIGNVVAGEYDLVSIRTYSVCRMCSPAPGTGK